jgi:hypothetical protein
MTRRLKIKITYDKVTNSEFVKFSRLTFKFEEASLNQDKVTNSNYLFLNLKKQVKN